MSRIVVDNTTKEIIGIGTFKGYWDNGYPIITDANGNDCAYVPHSVSLFEVDSIPESVEPFKYCYTEEKGFYENPEYEEPEEPIEPDPIQEYRDQLASEVSEIGYNA